MFFQEERMSSAKPFEIPKRLVWEAYQDVKAKGGAGGVDNESIEEFETNLKDNLYRLWNRLCSGSYFPPPVRGVAIPKRTGGTRLLGVPTISDRIAQTVVKKVLEPVLDPIFDEDPLDIVQENLLMMRSL
jgi:RNA-directed DNA polymerase